MSAHEAHEATEPVPSPGDEGNEANEGEDRAAAGAARFLRRHARTLIMVLVVAIAGYAAFAGPGTGGDGGGSGDRDGAGSGTATTAAPAGTGEVATTAPGAAAPGATEATDPAPTSTLVPPDIEDDRPAIDLATPPPATDPVEVARWWAGTYTAYIGAGPPADLVDRLADWTTPALLDELRSLPPAASYDAPLEIDGVSETELPAEATGGAPAGSRQLRVSVQTPVALVIYDMTLVQGSGNRWLVSEAARI